MYDAAWSLFIFSRFVLRKAYHKVGKFTFVSTKLASKQAIKLGGSYLRCVFQSFAIKNISGNASQERARPEIITERIVSFPSERELEYWSIVLDTTNVASTSTLVILQAEQIIV